MGVGNVDKSSDSTALRKFTKHLLADLRALEHMLEKGMFETGVRRIGAEQEFVLVDSHWRAASVGAEVLADLKNENFTTELGRFNVEFNLIPPLEFGHNCLSLLEQRLTDAKTQLAAVAQKHDAKPLLTGILPTHCMSNLGLDHMTPRSRYHAINDAIQRLRGSAFDCRFSGTDELIIRHDSVMLEACNTSCQFHFQVAPDEFARFYNASQAVAGPVLAAAANSPLLFGKRLWRESRIALLQQAVDTRQPGHQLEQRSARVSFGKKWVQESVLDILRDDIARFRVLLGVEVDEDPFESLQRGEIPKLKALQLYNSTIYRWNRPCYGVGNGKPHLRIENRTLPAGPTVIDQVANGAFWFGLINGVIAEYDDVTQAMDFATAQSNFMAAARLGLDTHFSWVQEKRLPAQTLIADHLLPLAEIGLKAYNIDPSDIEKYLGIIDARVSAGRTGARWCLDSYAKLQKAHTYSERVAALTASMWSRQEAGNPVHEWSVTSLDEVESSEQTYARVDQFMTTDIFTVHEEELIDLAASLMDWVHIRHIPVKNDDDHLVGILTSRQLLRFLSQDRPHDFDHPIAAREVMQPNPIFVAPDTPTLEAMEIMRANKISCLPVVLEKRVVGMVSERDFMRVAGDLMVDSLKESGRRD